MARFRILPALAAGRLGSAHYLYDGLARGAPVLHVPTQRVTERVCRVVARLKAAMAPGEAWELERLEELFADEAERKVLHLLREKGYLEEVGQGEGGEEAAQGLAAEVVAAARATFAATEAKHFFSVPRLFGLPVQVEEDAQVAFAGVPFASLPISAGAAQAPAFLRRWSQGWLNWFEVYEGGAYSEVCLEGGLPRRLGQGVVLRDFGDVGAGARTVGDLFSAAQGAVEELLARCLPAVFLGGDHAVTVPLVAAYVRHYPELVVIQLDAHNDLFFLDGPAFNHAATALDLLLLADVRRLVGLGLRTEVDGRMEAFRRLAASPEYASRVSLYSLGATKRLLADESALESVLAAVGERPCYLTIDLDVLSAAAMAGQVSTPAEEGLEWWELYQLVETLLARLPVVACDVVEFNPEHGAPNHQVPRKVLTLLVLLIDALARRRRKEAL